MPGTIRYGKPPLGTPLNVEHPLARGLAAFVPLWEGSGPPADAINNLPLRLQGSPAWAPGPAGPGLSCVGSGVGAATTSFSAALRLAFPVTIACGVRYYGATSSNQLLFSLDQDTTTATHVLAPYITATTGQFQVAVPSSGVAITSPATLAPNADYVLAADAGSSVERTWINGSPSAAGNWGLPTPTYTAPSLYIGQNPGGAARSFNFAIYWAAVWNRLLSAGEHREIARNPWQLFAPRHATLAASFAAGGGVAPSGMAAVTGVGYQFSGPIDATSLAIAIVVAATGAPVPGTTSYDGSTHLATFTPSPSTPLVVGGKYLVTVSGARALDGTPMIPAQFPFIPGGAAGGRYVPGRGRRVGRLIA